MSLLQNLGGASFLALVLAPGLAQAVESPVQGASPARAPETQLEEVVVTARRREENVQTVPISITAVPQEALRENNIQNFHDLQYLVPSMSAATTPLSRDSVNISIRGQGQNSTSGQPGVVAYLNEVPIPTNGQGDLAGGPGLLFDLENVEVLKGPQGTLFGRNSVGGALLLRSARPTNELGGRIEAGFGNYNDREVDGALNVPILSDVLLMRLAVNGAVRDGFTKLLGDPEHPNGIDGDNRDYRSVRGTVTFRPNDVFQNDTIASYSTYSSHGNPFILAAVDPNGLGATIFAAAVPNLTAYQQQQQSLGIRTAIPVDVPLRSDGSNLSVNNISRVSLSDVLMFRNIAGLDYSSQILAFDADATPFPIIDQLSTPRHELFHQYTEEAQLQGTSLAGRLEWTAGAFFVDDRNPGFVRHTSVVFGNLSEGYGRAAQRSHAVYVQGNYGLSSLLSGLSLTAGLRYTWDQTWQNTYGVIPPQPATPLSDASSALTWTVGLNYQVTADTLLYVTSRRGYRAGGFNGLDTAGNLLPGFDPEYVRDAELGIKSDWRVGDVSFRTNADLYYQDYTDIQVQALNPGADGALNPITSNAAAARLWGAELEAVARPTPHLQLGVTFDYLKIEYTSFASTVPQSQIDTLNATRTFDRPPRKYGLNVRYQLPLPPELGDVSARATWSWQDRSIVALAATAHDASEPGGAASSFGLLNASLQWDRIAKGPVDISLFGSNLTNKVYPVGGFAAYSSIGYSILRYGEPRMYGIRVRCRFGAEAR